MLCFFRRINHCFTSEHKPCLPMYNFSDQSKASFAKNPPFTKVSLVGEVYRADQVSLLALMVFRFINSSW